MLKHRTAPPRACSDRRLPLVALTFGAAAVTLALSRGAAAEPPAPKATLTPAITPAVVPISAASARTRQVHIDWQYDATHARADKASAWRTAATIGTVSTPLLLGGAAIFDFLVVGGAKRGAKSALAEHELTARTGVDYRSDADWSVYEEKRREARTLCAVRTVAYTTVGVTAVITLGLWLFQPTREGRRPFGAQVRGLGNRRARSVWSGTESAIVGVF